MTDPNRVVGGRERGPAMGTVILSCVVIASGVALFIARLATSSLSTLGIISSLLFVLLGCTTGWPALQRVRRNKRREAGV